MEMQACREQRKPPPPPSWRKGRLFPQSRKILFLIQVDHYGSVGAHMGTHHSPHRILLHPGRVILLHHPLPQLVTEVVGLGISKVQGQTGLRMDLVPLPPAG